MKPALLSPADRTEFLVGMGVSGHRRLRRQLFECRCGVLRSRARGRRSTDAVSRETIFEWWAVALDRQRSSVRRGSCADARRILERAEAERARDIDSRQRLA